MVWESVVRAATTTTNPHRNELYGRGEPAGDEDVIEGEYEEWD